MPIFSAAHPGVQLDATTLTNLEINETDLRGYFSTSAIIDLLNNNPTCVGIRVYNINPSTEFPALLAVCVLDNGADMQPDGTHIMCSPIDSPSNNVDDLSRLSAFEIIKKGYTFEINESEKFSSFFSKTMINDLVDGNAQTGLAFYKVIWLGGRSTHLAVTSNLSTDPNLGIPIIGLNGTGFNHCLSDQPCPGHCANVDANGVDIVSPEPMTAEAGDLTGHYIPIWDPKKL